MFKWLFKKKGCAKHMNNKLEVIGIDHGWSMMKTISQVFVTGVKEITTTPALFGDVLEYEGKFYKVGTVRQEVKDTKVEDDSLRCWRHKEHVASLREAATRLYGPAKVN